MLSGSLADHGIETIFELQAKSEDDLAQITSSTPRLLLAYLTKLPGTSCQRGQCPHKVVNHKLSANPYLSKYGDNWRSVIGSCTFMKQYMNVRDLVRHIHDKSKAVFIGTRSEND